MKKILMVCAAMVLTTGAFAQVQWGAKAGLNLADFSNVDESKMKPSFHVGVFADFSLGTYVSFQPELMYSRQGTFLKETFDGETYKEWTRFDYINLPLMFKFHIAEKLSVDVGPQLGFVINASYKGEYGGETETEDIDSDMYESFDVSAAMGLTYRVCRNIDVYARYNLGFTEVFKSEAGDKHKNNVIQVGVGYRF